MTTKTVQYLVRAAAVACALYTGLSRAAAPDQFALGEGEKLPPAATTATLTADGTKSAPPGKTFATAATAAQGTPGIPNRDAKETAKAALPAKERYLLKNDDHVIFGLLEKTDTGFALKRSGGTIFYPESQVSFVGDTLAELYQFKVQRVPSNDVPEHMKICRWCIANGLENEARAELESVLSLNPSDAEATRRLRLLSRKVEPKDEPGEPRKYRPLPADPKDIIEAAIRGHGKETFEQFVAIEKVLLNKCARCHSSTRYHGTFRMYRRAAGQPTDQPHTAKNLQSCLSSIDKQETHRSPLLYMSVTAHGPLSVAPFGGINDPSYKQLRDWVYRVVDTWASDDTLVKTTSKKEKAVKKHEKQSTANESIVATKEPKPALDEFGGGRGIAGSDKRMQRPEMPTRAPGDAPVPRSALRGLADDAPEPIVESKRHRPKSTEPAGSKIYDPFDPSAFNQSAPPPKADADSSAETKDKDSDEPPAATRRPVDQPTRDPANATARKSPRRPKAADDEDSDRSPSVAISRSNRTRRDPKANLEYKILECVNSLENPNALARAFAANRLAEMGPRAKSALPKLEKHRDDRDPKARDAIAKAISAISAVPPSSPADE